MVHHAAAGDPLLRVACPERYQHHAATPYQCALDLRLIVMTMPTVPGFYTPPFDDPSAA
jgi:hypothetical protein